MTYRNSAIWKYIQMIEQKKVTVCSKIRALYCSVLKPIVEGKSDKWIFDPAEGKAFTDFCHMFCKQSKGDWRSDPLDLMLFQQAKYDALLGIKSKKTGLRRYTECFDVRGRKNGKSTEESAFALYMEIEEPGAEVYVAATKFRQAKRIWDESVSMVEKSTDLKQIYTHKVFPTPEIDVKKFDSTYQVLSKETKTQDGLNISCGIVDEVHELDRSVYDVLKQGTSARSQPIINMISTAGFVRGGLFDDEYDYSTKVLNKLIEDDTLLPIVYEMDDEKEIYDESMWIKANPSLGVIKKVPYLQDQLNRAMGDLNYMNTVKVKDFNLVGVENKAWLTAADINSGAFGPYSEEEVQSQNFLDKFKNSYAIGAYDLSHTRDITAALLLLPDENENALVGRFMFWVTNDFLSSDQCKQSKVPFQSWIDRGLMRISGEHSIEYHNVAQWFKEMFDENGYIINSFMYDSWSATYLTEELESLGWSKTIQHPVIQGYKTLSMPMQYLVSVLKDGKLCCMNNPIVKWMMANVELVQDRNGNYMPMHVGDKSINKIDGVSVLLDALREVCDNMSFYFH